MEKQHAIPSMYHRRLLLITVVMLAVMLLLSGQLVRLSIVEGAEHRRNAEATLKRRTFLPTHRGAILDRHGRKLAVDRPGYAIALEFDVITGTWPDKQARTVARKAIGSSRWRAMSPEERDAAVAIERPHFEALVERLLSEVRRLGEIDEEELQARLDTIRREVQTLAAVVWESQRVQEQQRTGTDPDEFRPGKIREQIEAHVILTEVSDDVAFAFRSLGNELPDMFEVRDARRREYPWTTAARQVVLDRNSLPRPVRSDVPLTIVVEGVADHILGSMRDAQAEDVARRPFRDPKTNLVDLGGYATVDDRAGATGLERSLENELRGTRGEVRRRVDSEHVRRTAAVPGRDVALALDIELQARVQAICSHASGLTVVQPWHQNGQLPEGWPLNSAAVVLEVATGEILAMVSMPTRAMGSRMDRARQTIDQPWSNRPVEAIYPPGSIIKPLVLCAAVGEGVHRLEDPITCGGHFFPDKPQSKPRCWIYREVHGFQNHGPLKVEDAIARSCNIYFYTLADRLNMLTLADWYRRFGLGAPLDVGLLQPRVLEDGTVVHGGEHGGTLPTPADLEKIPMGGRRFANIIMGIGQGPVTWTPVQAANAYATLARGGLVRDATLFAAEPREGTRPQREDLPLALPLVTAALEGLRRSVEESYGSGHHIRYPDRSTEPVINATDVTVWAKTGTAQAPALLLEDVNGDGRSGPGDRRLAGLDHAWFVGLVGPEATGEPMYALAVIVEYGGSGGRVAGPIANQVIHALQDEGYLPGASWASIAGASP